MSWYLYKVHSDPKRATSKVRSVVKARSETASIGKKVHGLCCCEGDGMCKGTDGEPSSCIKVGLAFRVTAEDCTIPLNAVSDRCSCRSPE